MTDLSVLKKINESKFLLNCDLKIECQIVVWIWRMVTLYRMYSTHIITARISN